MADAVYVPLGDDRFEATELARGPWDPGSVHGGAPSALIARQIAALPEADGMLLSRLAVDFYSAVPLGECTVNVKILRPGRRMLVAESTLTVGDRCLCRATGVLMREAAETGPLIGPPAQSAIAPPEQAQPHRRSDITDNSMFGGDAMEILFVNGHFSEQGPATAWFRWRREFVAGEQPTPLELAVAATDFGNGISNVLDFASNLFVNTDLTVHLEQYPRSEWVALQSHTTTGGNGTGLSRSTLYDKEGAIGAAAQSLFVDSR